MNFPHLFWLHIKKSAGMTTRRLLQPLYKEVDRAKKPKTFIQATPGEYNDILNNFRVVLGEYQFKRTLFAKTYLYPSHWNSMHSFAFSREPIDRCISMFYYLYWSEGGYYTRVRTSLRRRKLLVSTSYAFDAFLDHVHEAHSSDSIYHPLGLHFSTHTAPMWDDITDGDGNVLLCEVFRMEALAKGVDRAFEACGSDKRVCHSDTSVHRNKNKNGGRKRYSPTKKQVAKIEQIYPRDFEIYENALH